MSRPWFLALAAAGCVFHTDDFAFDDDRNSADDVSLWVEPNDVEDGQTIVFTVTDDYGQADFREAWDVRALGDFQIVEWSAGERALSLVVEVAQGASGEQPLAVDFSDGTVFTSFQAY